MSNELFLAKIYAKYPNMDKQDIIKKSLEIKIEADMSSKNVKKQLEHLDWCCKVNDFSSYTFPLC